MALLWAQYVTYIISALLKMKSLRLKRLHDQGKFMELLIQAFLILKPVAISKPVLAARTQDKTVTI